MRKSLRICALWTALVLLLVGFPGAPAEEAVPEEEIPEIILDVPESFESEALPEPEAAGEALEEETPADGEPVLDLEAGWNGEELELVMPPEELEAPVPQITLSLPASSYMLMIGASLKLPIEAADAEGRAVEAACTLTSSAPKIAAIEDGAVKGKRAGKAEITLTAEGGAKTVCEVTVVKKARKAAVAESLELAVGEKVPMPVKVYTSSREYIEGSAPEVLMGLGRWKSSDASVVKVDAQGCAVGGKSGKVVLTFTTMNGKSASCSVQVLGAPTSLKLDPSKLSLPVGGTFQLAAVFGENERGLVRWKSSDKGVITVDDQGLIRARSVGTATVTAASDNGLTARCAVTVTEAPAHVSIQGGKYLMLVKDSLKLPLTFTTADGTDVTVRDYTLTSDAPKVVSVSGTTLTALKAGTAVITVAAGALKASCQVQVIKRVKKVELSSESLDLAVGGQERLLAKVYTSSKDYILCDAASLTQGLEGYASGKPSVVSVSADGTLTGLAKGEAKVTFTAGGRSAACRVRVLGAPTRIELDRSAVSLPAGGTFQLSASFGNNELGVVTYESSNGKIASVDAQGLVRGLKEGSAVITARTGKLSAECALQVTPAPARASIEGQNWYTLPGASFTLPVAFSTADGRTVEGVDYTLTSSAPKIASVSGGKISGLREGTAVITLQAGNLTARCKVTVQKKPRSVELSATKLELGVGERRTLTLGCKTSSKAGFLCEGEEQLLGVAAFSSSQPSVVRVSRDGVVTALNKGTATLTCTTANGRKAQCQVQVMVEATRMSLSPASLALLVGESASVMPKFPSGERSAVSYASSDSAVATVAADGTVKAKKAGSAVITARTDAGLTAQCTLQVYAVPRKISLNLAESNMAIKGKLQLKASAEDAGGSALELPVSWSTSDKKIATVDGNGLVTALKAGTATITASLKADPSVRASFIAQVRKAPTGVSLSLSQTKIGVGQSVVVSGVATYKKGSCTVSHADSTYVRVKIGDTSIARYDAQTGRIVGLDVGRTTVQLVTYNNKTSKAVTLEVSPGTDWLLFNEPVAALGVGQSMRLTCATSTGSVGTIRYESSEPAVVTVNGSGNTCTLTAKKAGSAYVTARATGGASAQCLVTVLAAPTGVKFAAASLSIRVGEQAQLPDASVLPASGDVERTLTYTSDNACAKVSSDGRVSAVSVGTARITAKTFNGHTAVCTVRVLAAPTRVTVTAPAALPVGGTCQLTGENDASVPVEWTSSDPEVLAVSAGGLATAVAPGTAVVTAVCYNGIKGTATVSVRPWAAQLDIRGGIDLLTEGETLQLTAVTDGGYGEIRWRSGNEAVVRVDGQGKVTAVKAGTATLRAFIDGRPQVFDALRLTVKAPTAKLELSSGTLTLAPGGEALLKARLLDAEGQPCGGTVTFTSSDPAAASVDEEGRITALKAGKTVVTAAGEGVSARCTVTVAAAALAFRQAEIALGAGERIEARSLLSMPAEGLQWTSSEPNVLRVRSGETLQAISAGTAKLTAVLNGQEASCLVTVHPFPESMTLNAEELWLALNETRTVSAAFAPRGSAATLRFSAAGGAARVSGTGRIRAVSYGTSVITVTAGDRISQTLTVHVVRAPETVHFAEGAQVQLCAGDERVLPRPLFYSAKGASGDDYTLSTSDPAVLTVDVRDGRPVLKGKKAGSARVRLKTAGGLTAWLEVTVAEAPGKIAFEAATVRLALGGRWQPLLQSSDGTPVEVTLSSSDERIAAIDEEGFVRAAGLGTATVTARAKAFAGLTAKCTVRVEPLPTHMTMDVTSARIAAGESLPLGVRFDGAALEVDWSSSNGKIALVSASGLVQGVAPGSAVITATAAGGLKAQCTVTVGQAPTQLTASPASLTLCLKDSARIQPGFEDAKHFSRVRFTSGDPSVAVVDENGAVTPKGRGETEIELTTFGGLTARVPVTVLVAPTSLSLSPATASMLAGDTAALTLKTDKGGALTEWESSDPAVLTVDAQGQVKARKAGTAVVTASMPGPGLSARCTIRVLDDLTSLTLKAPKTTLSLKESVQLQPVPEPSNLIGSGKLRYSSSNEAVAQVDAATGVVTGVSCGKAVISVRTSGGQAAKITVSVLGGQRRMLIVYFFDEKDQTGYLPFARNNARSVKEVFSAAQVEGQRYQIAGPYGDLSKAALLKAIDKQFGDAGDDDVSVLYLCAHGFNDYGRSGEYAFALDATHFMTGSELMNRLERIRGRVVLVLDSCYSGAMIDSNLDRLKGQDGRIAVIASSSGQTNSSYWKGADRLQSVDFYTYSLLEGLGYNEAQGIGGDRGWKADGNTPADASGNGKVTLKEWFDYAKKLTMQLVKQFKDQALFRGNEAQTPQSFFGALKNLILFGK